MTFQGSATKMLSTRNMMDGWHNEQKYPVNIKEFNVHVSLGWLVYTLQSSIPLASASCQSVSQDPSPALLPWQWVRKRGVKVFFMAGAWQVFSKAALNISLELTCENKPFELCLWTYLCVCVEVYVHFCVRANMWARWEELCLCVCENELRSLRLLTDYRSRMSRMCQSRCAMTGWEVQAMASP